jgi:hypothetical protein
MTITRVEKVDQVGCEHEDRMRGPGDVRRVAARLHESHEIAGGLHPGAPKRP